MKNLLIEQQRKNKNNEQNYEEKYRILNETYTKLQEEKQKIEIQLSKMTEEYGKKTEEFRNALLIMKENNETRIFVCFL